MAFAYHAMAVNPVNAILAICVIVAFWQFSRASLSAIFLIQPLLTNSVQSHHTLQNEKHPVTMDGVRKAVKRFLTYFPRFHGGTAPPPLAAGGDAACDALAGCAAGALPSAGLYAAI